MPIWIDYVKITIIVGINIMRPIIKVNIYLHLLLRHELISFFSRFFGYSKPKKVLSEELEC